MRRRQIGSCGCLLITFIDADVMCGQRVVIVIVECERLRNQAVRYWMNNIAGRHPRNGRNVHRPNLSWWWRKTD